MICDVTENGVLRLLGGGCTNVVPRRSLPQFLRPIVGPLHVQTGWVHRLRLDPSPVQAVEAPLSLQQLELHSHVDVQQHQLCPDPRVVLV